MSNMKWFERDELPRAVIDNLNDLWVLNAEQGLYGLAADTSNEHRFDHTGKELET